MHFLAFSGSLHSESSNTALLRALGAMVPEGVTLSIYEGLADLPHFDPGLEVDPLRYQAPLPVMDLRARLASADAVIFCTPEYAFGMPGVLKNALDWMVAMAVMEGKPVAALAASPSNSGGDKAHQGLVWVLTALGTEIVEGGSFALPRVRSKISAEGTISDPGTRELLEGCLRSLARVAAAKAGS